MRVGFPEDAVSHSSGEGPFTGADGPGWEGVSMAGRPGLYNPAILSCDEKPLVHAAFSFEEGALTDGRPPTAARSVRLLRAEP